MSVPQLVLLSKSQCHLCVEAKEIVHRLRKRIEFDLQLIDLANDPDLKAQYEYEVPVLFLNGRKIFKYKIDEKQLEEKLRRNEALPEYRSDAEGAEVRH